MAVIEYGLDATCSCGLQTVMLRMLFIRDCLTDDIFLKDIIGDISYFLDAKQSEMKTVYETLLFLFFCVRKADSMKGSERRLFRLWRRGSFDNGTSRVSSRCRNDGPKGITVGVECVTVARQQRKVSPGVRGCVTKVLVNH